MRGFLRTLARVPGLLFFLLFARLGLAQEIPFAYWNFNNPAALFAPNAGPDGASIEFEPAAGSEAISGTGQDFNGENALHGDPAGSHLRVNLPIGSKLIFNVPTTAHSAIKVKYETRRSGSGAGVQAISYSVDGSVFTPFTTVYPRDGVPEVVTLDFSGVEGVDDNPNFKILIEFSAGAGGASGNNRFDNVTVVGNGGEVVPVADVALRFPRNKAMNVAVHPTFRWSGQGGPYTLQISDTETFQNLILQQEGLADTITTLTDVLEGSTTYFWRVGVTIEDDEVVFSEPAQFTTHQAEDTIAFSNFMFNVSDNTGNVQESIVCEIYGDSLILGVVPSGIDVTRLIAGFVAGAADSVAIDGIKQESQWSTVDFSSQIEYSLFHDGNAVRRYSVKLVNSGIPIVYINTDNSVEITSKDDYVTGRVTIIDSDGSLDLEANTGIKGRGNSTWLMPKKPYRLKLNSKASVLGYPADKDWVLLANYADKSLMRNSLAFALGDDFGLAYNNRTQPVELVINGVYQGSYLLGEHVKVAQDRVNITELSGSDNDDESITGGYFLEVDARLDEAFWFYSSWSIPFTIKSPEDITSEQLSYINNYINETETVLASASFDDPINGYSKYIDTESFIKWYWVNELLRNNDAIFFSSVFMYKDRNDKLKMGPLWDFDIGAGNINFNGNDNPVGWWVRQTSWFSRLMQDPAFQQKAYQFWRDHRVGLEEKITDFIDSYADRLTISQDLNFMKWPILNEYVWPNAVVTGSYEGEVDYLKSWIVERIRWIDSQVDPQLRDFSLAAPANANVITVDKSVDSLVFSWSKAATYANYTVTVEQLNGDERSGLWTFDDLGIDTTYAVKVDDVVAMMEARNVSRGDTLALRWHVRATIGIGYNQMYEEASEAFDLFLINRWISPPKLLFPEIGSQVASSARTLQWQTSGVANGFVVQLSSSPDFDADAVLLSEYTTDNVYNHDISLRSLTWYYWRVKAIVDDDSSAWSDGNFSVLIPPAPEIDLRWQSEGQNEAVVSWTTETGHKYIIEISQSEDFSQGVIHVENWDAAEYILDGLDAGLTYYVRVKAVNADVESEWSVIRVLSRDIPTSVEVSLDSHALSIYPNPTRDKVRVRIPSGSEINDIEIRDARGVLLFLQAMESGTVSDIDMGSVPAGVYVVVLRSSGRIVAAKKLVRQ